MSAIELTEVIEEPKRRRLLTRFTLWATKWVAVIGIIIWSSLWISKSWQEAHRIIGAYWKNALGWVVSEAVAVEPVRIVLDPMRVELDAVIEAVATSEGVSPTLLKAIARKESSGGAYLYAFEPGVFERIDGIARGQFAKRSRNEKLMLSSSHGPMHVMGWVAETVCGIPWHELYDRAANIRCAVAVLKSKPGRSLRETLRNYNGSGDRAEQYADAVLAIITEMSEGDLSRGVRQ